MRGLALVVVLMAHAQVPWAEGGFVALDVFYVMSGFLITGLIMNEHRKRGTVSIKNFYARRAKRLLPAASTVLVFIAVGSLIVFNTVRQVDTGGDILAAALYFVNWRFIVQDVDYFAFEEGLLSPVQHYWSLSVEEQFYLLWPVLILAFGALALRYRRNPTGVILLAIIPFSIASLAYSIWYTPLEPERAYFSTLTRAWELGFGAVLALTLPRVTRISALTSTLLMFGGVAAILGGMIVFNEIDPYPGWRCLIPVLGTLAVMAGGTSVHRGPAIRVLSIQPLQYLGKISYNWYLWHWPFIIFAIAIWGHLDMWWLIVVTLVSWIPAELCHRFIEEPFRRSKYLNVRPKKALAIAAVFTVSAIAAALVLSVNRVNIDLAPQDAVAGAAAVTREGGVPIQEEVTQIRPDPLNAREDRGAAFAADCLITGPVEESGECVFGNPDGEKTVVIFGDSHGLQYTPALIPIAEEQDWRLVVLTRGGCLVADLPYAHYCDRWRANSLERIEREQPDLTIVTSTTLDRFTLTVDGQELTRNESQPHLVEAMADTLERLKEASGQVALIRDQPRAPFLPHECVADNPDDLRECVFEPDRLEFWAFDLEGAERAGVPVIDPFPMICRENACPSVIGDVLVYRDTYHFSASFAHTLVPWLSRQLPDLE